MSRKDNEIINLSTDQYMEYMLKFYELLSNGRTKPDNKGGGTVRESKEECDVMAMIKMKMIKIFNLDTSINYEDFLSGIHFNK